MSVKIRKADKLFSDYVKKRDGYMCKRCRNTPDPRGLHCSHYWGRGRESTRFEPDNADALCMYCHRYWGHGDGREEYKAYMIKKLGIERYKSLEVQANTYKKKDDKLVIIWLQELLKK